MTNDIPEMLTQNEAEAVIDVTLRATGGPMPEQPRPRAEQGA